MFGGTPSNIDECPMEGAGALSYAQVDSFVGEKWCSMLDDVGE